MANRYRGEASLQGPNGSYTLRLSLDALAHLETAFEAENLCALTKQLLDGDLTAAQLQTVLTEALVAGGDVNRQDANALLAEIGKPLALRAAYVDLMRATFAP
jgi:hypothetical protein